MITDFSLHDIISGCITSKDFNSPECNLLSRVAEGRDIPSYPEFIPDKQYFYQLPDEDFERGPTDYFEFYSIEEFLLDCLEKHGEYPQEIWEK